MSLTTEHNVFSTPTFTSTLGQQSVVPLFDIAFLYTSTVLSSIDLMRMHRPTTEAG